MPYKDPVNRTDYNRRYYEANRDSRNDRNRTLRRVGAPTSPEEKKVLFQVRMPISLIARMQRLVDEGLATGKYPWKSRAEVVKALIMRGFESMTGDPLIDEMLPYLRAVQQIDSISAHRREAQAAFSRLVTEITELNKIRAFDQAANYFQVVLHAVEEMSPNVWRDWLLEKMRKAFPKYVTMKVKTMRLAHHQGEPERDQRRRKADRKGRR